MPPNHPDGPNPPKDADRAHQPTDADASATARADARSVIAANQAFYDAFARGDLPVIEAMWAHTAPVACIHPGWGALHGREEVIESWRSILGGGSATSVRCTRPSAAVIGDSAYVVCGEMIQGAELVATNFFVREEGAWKLVHHHAGPVHRRAPEPRPRPRSGTLN